MSSDVRRAKRAHLQTDPVKDSQNPTADSYQNLLARTGLGTDNLASAGNYALNPLTRNRNQLEALYRGSWIAGVAVDAVADDMTRAGIDFIAGLDPEGAETLHKAFDRLNLWGEIADTIRWARLYGGAIAVMLIDGQNFSEPLRPETVQKDQFKGLITLDRWQLMPVVGKLIESLGPDFGKPEFYTVVADQSMVDGMRSPLMNQTIHHSRVLRFEGDKLPFYQRLAEWGWGMSVIERIYDRLVAFDSTTSGAAQLAFKAHLRTLSIEGLTKILSGPKASMDTLVARVEQLRRFQTNEGLSLIDSNDKLEHYNYTFSGLGEMILQFAQQIAGSLRVPLVVLLGQSPAGLNSSGDSDWQNYDSGIKSKQEKDLRSPMTRLVDVLHRSELGVEPDKGFNFSFNPLRQIGENEQAEIAQKTTASIIGVYEASVISHATTLRELRKTSEITGIFSTITDEDINAADQEPPDPAESMLPMIPGQMPGQDPEGEQPPGGAEPAVLPKLSLASSSE